MAALDGKADELYWLTPQSIAGGKVILCTLARVVGAGPQFQIVAVSVASGERRLLVDDAKRGRGTMIFPAPKRAASRSLMLDAVLAEVGSPILANAVAAGTGRTDMISSGHRYAHLSPLVAVA